MTQQTIGIGASANDGTGDTPRAAFNKVNQNFTELYGGFLATVTTQALARTALGYGSVALLNSVSLTTNISGILPVANGGTGTASPGLVAGTGVTITGSWPNQTINASGGGGSFTGGAVANPIQITGGTQTTNNPIEDNTQTWNASGTTFTANRTIITDSASAAASMFEDWQIAGSGSRLSIRKDGTILGNTNGFYSSINLNGTSPNANTVDINVGTGTFKTTLFSLAGTNDVFFQALPPTTAGYGVLEAWSSAGLILGTGNNANPVIFKVNRVEAGRFTSTGFSVAGNAALGGQLSVTGNSNLGAIVASGAGTFAGGFGFQFDSMFTQPTSGTVSQKNGTASQTFRLYGTASGGNDAYAEFNHSTGGAFTLATKQTGSGAASSISLDTPSSVRVIRSAANTGGNLTIVGGAGSDTSGGIGSSWALGVIGPDGTTYKAGIRADGFVAGTAIGTSDSNTAAFDQVNTPKGVKVNSTSMFTFSSASAWWQTIDLALARNAAGVAEINNGVAGTYRDLKLRNLIFSDGTQLATSPARALLTTITPTAVASIAYTSIPSGYSKFEIEFDNVTNANGGANEAPLIALSANNGTTYDSSQCGAANTGLSGAMYGRISIAPVGVTANKIAEGAATQGTVYWAIGGKWTSQTGVTNAIRFAWSGGSNFVAQGAIRIYGIV